jgi:hypothetical protein
MVSSCRLKKDGESLAREYLLEVNLNSKDRFWGSSWRKVLSIRMSTSRHFLR